MTVTMYVPLIDTVPPPPRLVGYLNVYRTTPKGCQP
jgi:hypothetical protein